MREDLRCEVCGESTVKFDGEVATCMTCDNEIEEAVLCSDCGNAFDKDEEHCPFCGEENEQKDRYLDCDKCSNEFLESEDINKTGLCEDCRDAYSKFGDDDLLNAICEEFGCYPHDVEYDREYEEMTIEGNDYEVLDEDGVKEDLKDNYFDDMIWSFSSNFLSSVTGIDSVIFETLADSGKCESLNEGLKDIVEKTCGMDEFVDEAISWDGLGHFTEDRYTVVGDLFLKP